VNRIRVEGPRTLDVLHSVLRTVDDCVPATTDVHWQRVYAKRPEQARMLAVRYLQLFLVIGYAAITRPVLLAPMYWTSNARHSAAAIGCRSTFDTLCQKDEAGRAGRAE